MCFKRKEKPVKLGQINLETNQLEKFSKNITWNLDYTICIFIRDSLKAFKKVYNGIPPQVIEEFPNEDDAIRYYDNTIQDIINDFDYCITNAFNYTMRQEEIETFEMRYERGFNNLRKWLPTFWW
jgi:hypothetical protein